MEIMDFFYDLRAEVCVVLQIPTRWQCSLIRLRLQITPLVISSKMVVTFHFPATQICWRCNFVLIDLVKRI